jgi:hypothetical protein
LLLPYAETAEDVIEQLFRGGLAGKLSQVMQSRLQVCGDEFGGSFSFYPFPDLP